MQQSGVLGLSIQGDAEHVRDFRSAPLVTQAVFADMLGLSRDVIRGWIESGVVPSVKIGRRRVVNLHQFRKDMDQGKTIFCAGDYSEE